MTVDDILTLSYADGTLTADQAEALDDMARLDPKLAEQLALLRASKLDYRVAFDVQALAPVPQHLTDAVFAMSQRAVDANSASRMAGIDPEMDVQPHTPVGKGIDKDKVSRDPTWPTVTSWMKRWSGWIATFGTGALSYAVMLHLIGPKPPGVDMPLPATPTTVASETASTPQWIKAAAGYQQLFSRETVANSQMTDAAETKVVNAIREQDRLAIRIPNLSASGLNLKTVLRLRYHGDPLIQIVYLPERGTPIALCVVKDVQPANASQAERGRFSVENMDVVTWRRAGLQYALIAAPGRDDLEAIAKVVRFKSDT